MSYHYVKNLHGIFRIKYLYVSFLLFSSFIKINAQTATQVTLGGTSTVININNNTATVVDPAITLSANGTITGFTVSITGSYTSGDVLSYTGSLPSGVSAAAFNTSTRSLVFTGTTSAPNWQALLRTVTLTTTSAVCNPESRKVSFVVGNKYYNIINGHFYEYYSTASTWTNAKTYIAGLSYFGREAYMATLTSAQENSFVAVLIGQNSWIGCSDNLSQVNAALGYTAYASQSAVDGNFYWVTGPERGTKISSQNAWGSGGVLPVSGVYNNWTTNEPNDYPGLTTSSPGQEDYGHMYSSTYLWNDFPNSSTIGTIFEYGGMPNDITTSQVVHTRDVTINGAPSGTITGGNVSVCSGTNSTTLTLTGLTGTVVRWESSLDNFLTAGTTISNTTTSHTVTNISTSTYYRVIVNSSSGCTNLATSPTSVSVSTTVAGNIVASNNTICAGSMASFNLFGHSGSVVKWQVSTSSTFASSVTDISNTTTALNHTLVGTGTYYFRAVVQNSGCGSPVNTPGYTISVISGTSPVGGSITNAEHCGGSNSGTLTLSGHTGSVSKWQYSTDGGIVWTDVSNTTTSLSYSSVSSNRTYRALITNGSCGSTYSSTGTITVYGGTVTRWDGGTSSAWQTSSNWCGGIADNGIDVVISPTATNHIVLDQSRSIGTLNFNGSGKYISIGNYTLTASTISNPSSTSYVKTNGSGQLKMNISNGSSVTFAVGDATYNPVTITNNTGSSDYLSVRVLNEVFVQGTTGFTSSAGRVKRTWDISKTNANAGSGLNFVFNWNAGETVSLSTPALYHYEAGSWEQQLGSTSSLATSLTYIGYTGTFSPFAIGNGLTPLDAKLVSFDAKPVNSNHTVLLNWTTANEENNSHFEILRSFDGRTWSGIGKTEAAGSNGPNTYSFIDQHPGQMNFYRLKQVDLDGKFTLHMIRQADFNTPHEELVKLSPNPSSGKVEIVTAEPAVYTVYDVNGRSVLEGEVRTNTIVDSLSPGMYTVHVKLLSEKSYYIKLVIE